MAKQKMSALNLALDIIGFALVVAGATLLRYASHELLSILAGAIVAVGLTILSASRYFIK